MIRNSGSFRRTEMCFMIFYRNDEINKISYTDNVHRKLGGLKILSVTSNRADDNITQEENKRIKDMGKLKLVDFMEIINSVSF